MAPFHIYIQANFSTFYFHPKQIMMAVSCDLPFLQLNFSHFNLITFRLVRFFFLITTFFKTQASLFLCFTYSSKMSTGFYNQAHERTSKLVPPAWYKHVVGWYLFPPPPRFMPCYDISNSSLAFNGYPVSFLEGKVNIMDLAIALLGG